MQFITNILKYFTTEEENTLKVKEIKHKTKNSFIDLKIEFKGSPLHKDEIKVEEIVYCSRFISFEEKPHKVKQEIRLNDFLKICLRKRDAMKKLLLGIDVSKMNKEELKYNENEFTLEKIGRNSAYGAPLKRLAKFNCDTDENLFSIKILKSFTNWIIIGIGTDTHSFIKYCFKNEMKKFAFSPIVELVLTQIALWRKLPPEFNYPLMIGINCHNTPSERSTGVWKWYNKVLFERDDINIRKGDIIGLKYDSKKGMLSLYHNGLYTGITYTNIDTSFQYFFTVTLYDVGDKIEIV